MCILCNSDSLRLLAAPLATLSSPEMAEAIRAAREAAMQLVLDTVDAWADFGGPDDAASAVEPETYIHYVIDRAERDRIASADEVRTWSHAVEAGALLRDPRVQAFLSSTAEGLAVYITQIGGKRMVLERFLEVPSTAVAFAGIGVSGEIGFDCEGDRFIVLTDDEAMQIAMDYIASELWREDPAQLLRYTSLPDEGISILTAAQEGPQDRANEILAGIVDVALLAEDTTRQGGYGRFVAEGITDDYTEQRFGDQVVLRLKMPAESEDEG